VHEVELATRVSKDLHQISAGRGARVLEVNLRVGEINEPRSLGLWLKKLGGDEFNSTGFNIVRCQLCQSASAATPVKQKAWTPTCQSPGLELPAQNATGMEHL